MSRELLYIIISLMERFSGHLFTSWSGGVWCWFSCEMFMTDELTETETLLTSSGHTRHLILTRVNKWAGDLFSEVPGFMTLCCLNRSPRVHVISRNNKQTKRSNKVWLPWWLTSIQKCISFTGFCIGIMIINSNILFLI